MPKTYKVSPEILQEFRDWKKMHRERFNHTSEYWLADYMNNFHMDVAYAYNIESSYHFKTGRLDTKLFEVHIKQGDGDLVLKKTAREYYADIRSVIDHFGFNPNKMTGSLRGTPSDKRKNLAQRMKIFLSLQEMGYNRMDLIG